MKLIKLHENITEDYNSEICNECGKSVLNGTGLFINRVADLNDKSTRISMGKPFPLGDYICSICDNSIYNYDLIQ